MENFNKYLEKKPPTHPIFGKYLDAHTHRLFISKATKQAYSEVPKKQGTKL